MALEKWLSNVAKTGDYNDLENKPEVNSDLNVSSDTIMASAKSVKIVNDKVEEIKNNVDGGKDNIANAITSKGIEASKDETFESLSEKIKNIKTGVDTTDANAVSGDIISGKTAYVNDIKVTGSLVNQPSIVDAISVGQDGTNKFFRIPQGAYVNNASENYPEIKCNATSIDENIKPENIIKGKTICGVEGTATIESLGGERITTIEKKFTFKTSSKNGQLIKGAYDKNKLLFFTTDKDSTGVYISNIYFLDLEKNQYYESEEKITNKIYTKNYPLDSFSVFDKEIWYKTEKRFNLKLEVEETLSSNHTFTVDCMPVILESTRVTIEGKTYNLPTSTDNGFTISKYLNYIFGCSILARGYKRGYVDCFFLYNFKTKEFTSMASGSSATVNLNYNGENDTAVMYLSVSSGNSSSEISVVAIDRDGNIEEIFSNLYSKEGVYITDNKYKGSLSPIIECSGIYLTIGKNNRFIQYVSTDNEGYYTTISVLGNYYVTLDEDDVTLVILGKK